jgi:hypothetical protein
LLVTESLVLQELECCVSAEVQVLGLIDNTHPAFTELLGDLVVADGLADHDTPILA